MAQSQLAISSPAAGSRGASPSSFAAIIEWQITGAALGREAARVQPKTTGETAAVLGAWRAAERSLGDHLETGPQRARLMAEVARLRAKYHRLFEARCGADTNLRSG